MAKCRWVAYHENAGLDWNDKGSELGNAICLSPIACRKSGDLPSAPVSLDKGTPIYYNLIMGTPTRIPLVLGNPHMQRSASRQREA